MMQRLNVEKQDKKVQVVRQQKDGLKYTGKGYFNRTQETRKSGRGIMEEGKEQRQELKRKTYKEKNPTK